MRRLVLASAVILATTAGAATTSRPARDMPVINPDAYAPKDCPPTSRYEASRHGGPLGPQHLTDLPGADMYKAAYRHIGRCEVPIITRYNIGGNSLLKR